MVHSAERQADKRVKVGLEYLTKWCLQNGTADWWRGIDAMRAHMNSLLYSGCKNTPFEAVFNREPAPRQGIMGENLYGLAGFEGDDTVWSLAYTSPIQTSPMEAPGLNSGLDEVIEGDGSLSKKRRIDTDAV